MKKLFLLLGVLLPVVAQAQSFSIGAYNIGGGGGSSSGGSYSVSGAIGQPFAALTMSGGGFSLTPGFWSAVSAVQMPGSPSLAISKSNGAVIISWPSSSAGWTLQQTSDLASGAWTTSAFSINNNGVTQNATVAAPSGKLFFRLVR